MYKNNVYKSMMYFSKIKNYIHTKFRKKTNLFKLRLIFFNYNILARKLRLIKLNFLIQNKRVRINNKLIVSVNADAATTNDLQILIDQATPGDTINLQPNTNYYGNLKIIGKKGTPNNYINIIGTNSSSIIGNSITESYVIYIENCSYLFFGNNNNTNSTNSTNKIASGFNLNNAKKGFYANNCNNIIIKNLNIYNIGEEGVHFMNRSSFCNIYNNFISYTGLINKGYGEGIYIGTAYSNWIEDENKNLIVDDTHDIEIKNNYVYFTTAECLDIKEGTYNGLVDGNTFIGDGLSNENYADSWIDIKGRNWTINNNWCDITIQDGIQIHCINTGNYDTKSGFYNTISNNYLNCRTNNDINNPIPCPGYAVWLQTNTAGNKVISNDWINAAKGYCNYMPPPQ